MKTCLPRKTHRPRSVEHFYSTGPRPTLRMIDGDIVVVATNGKVLRHQPPGDEATLEMTGNRHNQTQITPVSEERVTADRGEPEIPFHLAPPPQVEGSTMSSGKK